MDRICAKCGKHFEGRGRDINCPDCRKKQEYPLQEKICKQCGVIYQARGHRSYYCPTCSTERKRAAGKRCKSGKPRKIGSTDLCELCGKPYVVNGGLQRFCPECSKARGEELKRIRGKEYYYNGGKERRKERVENRVLAIATCIICGKEFPLSGERSMCCSAECSTIHAKNLNAAYREEHAEELRERNRQWWAENGESRNEKRRISAKDKLEL